MHFMFAAYILVDNYAKIQFKYYQIQPREISKIVDYKETFVNL